MNKSQEELMNELQIYHFAVMDLHLYLDTHPTDRKALMLYNQYANQFKMLEDMYSRAYGTIDMHGSSYQYPFSWVVTPWPWMMRKMFRDEEE